MSANKRIKVDYLARVEGEGSLHVRTKDGEVKTARLGIFEPPRFFEGFLQGRSYSEAPDITARICGICPIAYLTSAINAMEHAFAVEVDPAIHLLRRLIYCGEWIESHALHIYMLHAPDFLGYEDAVRMAADHADTVKNGLRLKKIGNDLVSIIGGREIHPINMRVGGFYRTPDKNELTDIREQLKWAIDAAIETVRVVAGFEFPDFEQDYEYVALRHPDEYPLARGSIVSSGGIDIPVHDYESHFVEEHVEHSNALRSRIVEGGAYLTGPLARFNLNYDQLPDIAKNAAEDVGLKPTVNNQFKSIIVRAVELVFACHEAARLIDEYEPPAKPYAEVNVHPARGYGASEAPRGMLYHRYTVDDKGLIRDARIVPPTAQNQLQMEDDLREFVTARLDLPQDQLTWQCEQAVRNYDPCISCATHFLKLDLERE